MTHLEELALHLYGQLEAGDWKKSNLELIESAMEQVRRETWEAVAKMLDEDDVLDSPDELDARCKYQCFGILGRLSSRCRQQAQEA